MTRAGVRIGVGTRVMFDGEVFVIAEWLPSGTGNEVVLKGPTSFCRMSVVALLSDGRTRLIGTEEGPEPDDDIEPAATTLLALTPAELSEIRVRADHVREVLTGYRSGSAETAADGEPRAEFDPKLPLGARHEAKAAELGVHARTVRRWVADYRAHGEAGLVSTRTPGTDRVDRRWLETALSIMAEHTNESKPSEASVILQVRARLAIEYGPGTVQEPSRATAYRRLAELDKRHRTFSGTTKRNRDIANRPDRQYGKLRPTRPGEYVILDTTRLDVFALDPFTLRWVQVEMSAAMDWYTRCIVGLRLTPVSTKAVDAAAMMYQVFRPPLAPASWPANATWPDHGIPREVLIDPDQIDRTGRAVTGPALVTDTIVVDHGKIYVSEHLNSVCQRFGISIQPARLREGSDKGPLERFFRTVREGLLQYLMGYKGPDVNARGLDVEGHAFFYIDQLEAIVREWIGTRYHHRPHDALFDPGLPSGKMTPAQMFEHGMVRAGYIEAPRHPHLAYEFLRTEPRTIQPYGVQHANLIYRGQVLTSLSKMRSPYTGRFKNRWPIHIDPDDISRVYIRHPETREWHELLWEHATEIPMPFSEDTLHFARALFSRDHDFIDDQKALLDLFDRWQLGMGKSPAERRMALRLARQEAALSNQVGNADAESVAALTSVKALPQVRTGGFPAESTLYEEGDDDDPLELTEDYEDDERLDWA